MTTSSDKINVLGYTISFLILLGSSAIPTEEREEWHGKWFPIKPGEVDPQLDDVNNEIDGSSNSFKRLKTMGLQDPNCDDAEHNLGIDYDPKNMSHHTRYLCMENRKPFEPNVTIQPIIREYTVPDQYSALHRCMNESISYDSDIPTFGTHRSVWPVYGEYEYVPVQRWVHTLEHGAIVAAYHPCVNKRQLDEFRKLVKKCLYRHIITPYEKLDAQRPFALIAWGQSLEMSVVNKDVIVVFIRMSALQGPEKISRTGQYNAGIIEMAKIVSDKDDKAFERRSSIKIE